MIFGHLISASENLNLALQSDFRDNYFEGTQDGMWFSIIVMSTVGFGDIVPRTSPGRFLTILWIFLSIALTTILAAIITANFGNLVLVPNRAVESITSPSDLAPYRVGTALQYAQDKLLQHNPNMTVIKFPQNTQQDMLRALLNGTIDVAVDRFEAIQYYNAVDDEFAGRLLPIGPVFNQAPVSFGVRRGPGGEAHPLLRLLSLAVADATRGQWEEASTRSTLWFGDPTTISTEDPALPELERVSVCCPYLHTRVRHPPVPISVAVIPRG